MLMSGRIIPTIGEPPTPGSFESAFSSLQFSGSVVSDSL